MKYISPLLLSLSLAVTPYGGVWIEIDLAIIDPPYGIVTPYGGVWIEIILLKSYSLVLSRHALWRRVD